MATKAPITQEESRQLSKLRALGQGVRVYKVDDSLFCVPTSSNDGSAYAVTVGGLTGALVCNCPAGQNERPCKHVGAVEMFREAAAQLAAVRAGLAAELPLEPKPQRSIEEEIADLYPRSAA